LLLQDHLTMSPCRVKQQEKILKTGQFSVFSSRRNETIDEAARTRTRRQRVPSASCGHRKSAIADRCRRNQKSSWAYKCSSKVFGFRRLKRNCQKLQFDQPKRRSDISSPILWEKQPDTENTSGAQFGSSHDKKCKLNITNAAGRKSDSVTTLEICITVTELKLLKCVRITTAKITPKNIQNASPKASWGGGVGGP